MKIRSAILSIAAAALLAPAAFAATTVTKSHDCADALKKADAALAAHTMAPAAAKSLRDEGDKLCQSGKSAEGIKKLEEATKEAGGKAK